MTSETMRGQIATLVEIRDFLTAGHARFTLVSRRTGERKTFEVEVARPRTPAAAQAPEYDRPGYFARLLVGPDNEGDYHYLGFVHYADSGALKIKPNKHGWGAEAIRCFEWLLGRVNLASVPAVQAQFSEQAEFWHEGRCGRCGRTLTVPESVASGIGPVCAGK